MMKYRYTYYVLLCLALVGLASCEMKDELLGKGEQGGSGETGILDLKLKVVPPSYGIDDMSSKSSSTELIVPKAEDMIVKVFNASMELQDYFESVCRLSEKIPICIGAGHLLYRSLFG